MRLILALPGNEVFAAKLALESGAELGGLETRQFPDGEHYVRLLSDPAGRRVDIVCSLVRVDSVILTLLFVAAAVREQGATQVTLVAPYLGYMRQDTQFRDGEAVTSQTFARLLSAAFDRLVTVDPHLHRYAALNDIYGIPCVTLHAAALLGAWIRAEAPNALVIGPDSESEQWAAEVGAAAGSPVVVLQKERLGDRDVRITFPDLSGFSGRQPVLIDDIASSGRTLTAAARELIALGFARPICAVVHAVFGGDAFAQVERASQRVVSTDAVPHPTNAISLAQLVAAALRSEVADV
ncbi:ribose-phosphate pyrophosphokinase [uncultured Phenylobacterium sp.]|uniref:ribose-phosphate pyrophosphokinase n=1 Tax=uncultured Phenylobacterium sp. TaxID=349273 RepID=UPI0025DFD16A|nr:ribose-phosphate pyrophosphokinase [uncultured Phenylobacterium sp.]